MILKFINRNTFPATVAYVKDISETDITHGVLEFVPNNGYWVEWEIPTNCEVRVFNNGQPYLTELLIKNPTVEKLNKALKIEEI